MDQRHMPYEDTGMSANSEQEQETKREAPPREEPGRTPHSAEGPEPEKERKVPAGEPGKTPDSAECEERPGHRCEPPPY